VWNYLIFFVGEYSSVLPKISRVLSQIQRRFWCGISGKKLLRDNFQEFLCKPRLSSTKTCEISPQYLKFYSGSVLRWKNSHKYFHMLFEPRKGGTCIKKSQKEDTGEKTHDVLFSENQFCSLSVWDLLRLIPWVFWSEIFTRRSSLCLLCFGWDLSPGFVPRDCQ